MKENHSIIIVFLDIGTGLSIVKKKLKWSAQDWLDQVKYIYHHDKANRMIALSHSTLFC